MNPKSNPFLQLVQAHQIDAYGENLWVRLGGHWTRITEPVGGRLSYEPPINDINAPDLYIPCMAFATYLVLAGISLGLSGKLGDVIQPSKDPLEVLVGPLTRLRAKKFK
uniref:Uncharacterized protein n=1 Tax=Salix viminalis TaxID=40686 RepID=A0A6N2KRG7_SALVM